ncbi:MAG: hypothetical protein KDA47_01550 [Planctomycetales bacterium]|nr:hypothetical protein [Planctomycetales bacterium]
MKPRATTDDDDGGGLDSLLDTMTNVVGILVMVLIATQLGVKDAVDRISETQVIDAAALESARERLLITEQQRETLQSQLQNLAPADDQQIQVELANLRRQMDENRTKIREQETAANQYSMKIDTETKQAEAAKKKIADAEAVKAKRDELAAELTKALENEAMLKAKLDDTPIQQAPPPKQVTLPDPRPAPDGARQVTFLCTNNRVYPIGADDWRDVVRKKAEFVVASRRLDGGPTVGVDEERFMREFKKLNRSLHDDFFDVEIYASGIYPRLRFVPRENSGATIDEVLKPRSRFQRLLTVLDTSKYYARFIVLPDSYEAYLAARAVVDDAGLLAGWDPQGEGWEFTTHLGGSILFGPKPPPDPNAKPAPPAKPQNVID